MTWEYFWICFFLFLAVAFAAPADIVQWHANFVSGSDWYQTGGITKGAVAANGADMVWSSPNASYIQACSLDNSTFGHFTADSCAELSCQDGKRCDGPHTPSCYCTSSCFSGSILCALSTSVQSGPCVVGDQKGQLWTVVDSVGACMSDDGKTAYGIIIYNTIVAVEFTDFAVGLPDPSPFKIPCQCTSGK